MAIFRLVDPDHLARARREYADQAAAAAVTDAEVEAHMRAGLATDPEGVERVTQAWERVQTQRREQVRRRLHGRED